jgi:hypothetical protein
LPQCTARWEVALLLESLKCWRIGDGFIDGDDAGGDRMRGAEGLADEARSGAGITPHTQQNVDGLAGRIDGMVYIVSNILHLYVRRIDAMGVVRVGEMRPTALVELGDIPWHPPKDGGVIDGNPSLP